VLVEHARNVMGISEAVHAEYGAPGVEVVSVLSCSLDGTDIALRVRTGTRLCHLYGRNEGIVERTTCNYGLNPSLQASVEASGLVVSATDDTAEARAVERIDHPYFIGTLYQPQLRSTPSNPHPVFLGLVRAVLAYLAA
jgi:CTP synthase (UTP-ammonia lyase)